MTREEVEAALDSGNLQTRMNNGKWWKVRRNGKTQTWKKSPWRFRIPTKAGLHAYSEITETNKDSCHLRIVDDRGLT